MNAYITTLKKEKVWTLHDPKFVKDKGCKAIVVRPLHGLNFSRAAFRSHLADCMRQHRYESNKTNPDL